MIPVFVIALIGIGAVAVAIGQDRKFKLVLRGMSESEAQSALAYLNSENVGKVLDWELGDDLKIVWESVGGGAYWLPINRWGEDATKQLVYYERA